MIELNKIYNEDCLEGMKRIPDKSVDCIICDLPYGTTANKWDSPLDLNVLWQQYNRISKENTPVLLFAQRHFAYSLIHTNIKGFRYDIVWLKTRYGGCLSANKMPLRAHEQILVFYKKLPTYHPQFTYGKPYTIKRPQKPRTNYNETKPIDTYNDGRRYPIDVVKFPHDRISLHPTQKPVALIEYLVRTYTNEGDTVLDNCMGSGTTAIACINTNRNYIGFELDKGYYDIAVRRIEEAKRAHEQDLFSPRG